MEKSFRISTFQPQNPSNHWKQPLQDEEISSSPWEIPTVTLSKASKAWKSSSAALPSSGSQKPGLSNHWKSSCRSFQTLDRRHVRIGRLMRSMPPQKTTLKTPDLVSKNHPEKNHHTMKKHQPAPVGHPTLFPRFHGKQTHTPH